MEKTAANGWTRRAGLMAAIFASLIAALLFQEFAVRLALPAYNPRAHLKFNMAQGDLPPLGRPGAHRQINNVGDYDVSVAINQFGFRDDKDLRDSTTEDWFVVGDSYAFGWGVDEAKRFSNVLEARIGRRVFNIASPTNLDSYPKVLNYALANGARIGRVIVALNMSDDFAFDDVADPAEITPPPAAPRPGIVPVGIKGYLLETSGLYFLATSLVHGSPMLKPLFVRLGLIAPVGQAPSTDVTEAAARRGADILLALSRRFDLVVLIVPDPARWLGPEREKAVRAHSLVETIFRASGLRVVSPLAALEREGRPLDYHFRGDRHWNAAGHALAADALAGALRR